MATISEDYVSFETAKLLKEKGFDGPCMGRYSVRSREFHLDCTRMCNNGGLFECAAPTQTMTMKWLREVHNIHANIMYNDRYAYPYEFHIIKQHYASKSDTHRYTTYEECAEKSIKYCLENLI